MQLNVNQLEGCLKISEMDKHAYCILLLYGALAFQYVTYVI